MSFLDDPLWHKLRDFPLDDPESNLPFTRRLARDNAWQLAYALAVVEEYRRFLYLAKVAGHVVTPSDEVDQAWHLHLVYTRSYWDELCGEVLGEPLHHGPTRGGKPEQAKYNDLYARTLESYRRVFDETPREDVWPTARDRFVIDAVRVRRRDFWLIAKPWRRR
ncbi:MAG: hypothetical protein AAGD38_06825 [Acidobacteriota bacterium]